MAIDPNIAAAQAGAPPPGPTVPAKPLDITSLPGDQQYEMYKKSKRLDGYVSDGIKDPSSVFQNEAKYAMENGVGKTPIEQFKAKNTAALGKYFGINGEKNYCQGAACEAAREAGEPIASEKDGIISGTQTAEEKLPQEGYSPISDIETAKAGDMLHFIKPSDGKTAAHAHHAAMFYGDILDANKKKIGVKLYQNHGNGREKNVFTNYVNDKDSKWTAPAGEEKSAQSYDDLKDKFARGRQAVGGEGLRIWHKGDKFQEPDVTAHRDKLSKALNDAYWKNGVKKEGDEGAMEYFDYNMRADGSYAQRNKSKSAISAARSIATN